MTMPYRFLGIKSSKAQEVLLSFYFSLDKKIIEFYGLNYDFIDTFISRHFRTEKKYLEDKLRSLNNFYSPNSLAQRLGSYCEKIDKNDFNFSFEKKISTTDSEFFFGNASSRYHKCHVSNGSTYEMSKYVKYFHHRTQMG